jgi:hypothetical protein
MFLFNFTMISLACHSGFLTRTISYLRIGSKPILNFQVKFPVGLPKKPKENPILKRPN